MKNISLLSHISWIQAGLLLCMRARVCVCLCECADPSLVSASVRVYSSSGCVVCVYQCTSVCVSALQCRCDSSVLFCVCYQLLYFTRSFSVCVCVCVCVCDSILFDVRHIREGRGLTSPTDVASSSLAFHRDA